MPSRASPASTCCAARGASSARATCSTGGIRPRAAACARIARTTTSGCRGPRRYVLATGDAAVLDEPVHFLDGRAVNPEDDSYYDLPARSSESASLYQHCVRAIERGAGVGAHGLPLIGSGDWNDGMDQVGPRGKGESGWLASFRYH